MPLGQIFNEAVARHQAGQLDLAEAGYRSVLEAQPSHADAQHYLGLVAFQRADFHQAVRLIEGAIQAFLAAGADPPAECQINLGNALKRVGDVERARAAYRRAVSQRPDLGVAWYNLALLERACGDLVGAIEALQSACALDAGSFVYRVELGECLAAAGDDQGALKCFEPVLKGLRRLEKLPDGFDLILRTGRVLVEQGRYDLAFKALDSLKVVGQDDFEFLNLLGCAAAGRGNLGIAETHLTRARRVNPLAVSAVDNLATVFKDGGRVDEAISLYRELFEVSPSGSVPRHTWSNYLFTLLYSSKLGADEVLAEHRRAANEFLASAQEAPLEPLPPAHGEPLNRRLNIGYLSSDLRNHPVAYFLSSLLRNHDSQTVAVHLYDNSAIQDQWSERLRADAHTWRHVRSLSDRQLSECIRKDRIDVLIDLSGHTADNRLAALAYRPAPVQVSYLGYPFSTGLPWIDWRIVDSLTDPLGTEALSNERLWRLPRSYYAYSPPECTPELNLPPCQKRGYLTFGVSSNLAKVSDATLDFWARMLHLWPDSKLRWKARAFADPGVRAAMLDALQVRGVEKKRLCLEPWVGANSRWQFYHGVDICLDTYPYNQATNTCEALWMGVPTLSVSGTSHQSRMGASILADAGLKEWVLGLADLGLGEGALRERLSAQVQAATLSAMRTSMRDRLQESSLCDGKAAARAIEAACIGMYLQR